MTEPPSLTLTTPPTEYMETPIGFIRVNSGGSPMLVNVDQIACVAGGKDKSGVPIFGVAGIMLASGAAITVDHGPDTIGKMIAEACELDPME